jgi:hypothetical protein
MKEWLDKHVVPFLSAPPPHPTLTIHSFIWRGSPPEEVLVWLLADPASPTDWQIAVRRLLEKNGFSFDYTREGTAVNLNGTLVSIFGGDGAPFFNKAGTAMCRLFRRERDGTNLILDVGCRYGNVMAAKEAVKGFFGQFDGENPVELCARFAPKFGAA